MLRNLLLLLENLTLYEIRLLMDYALVLRRHDLVTVLLERVTYGVETWLLELNLLDGESTFA
jgi:hypothetical protein